MLTIAPLPGDRRCGKAAFASSMAAVRLMRSATIPLGQGDVNDSAAVVPGSVVDDAVKPPVALKAEGHQTITGVGVAEIDRRGHRSVEGGRDRLEPVRVDRIRCTTSARTLRRDAPGDRMANAPRRAGDDDSPTFEAAGERPITVSLPSGTCGDGGADRCRLRPQ